MRKNLKVARLSFSSQLLHETLAYNPIRLPECTIDRILLVLNYIHILTVLTISGTKFMDIYPEKATQKDQSIQADMFLVVSLPKQSSPAFAPEVTISFDDDDTT